MAEVARVPEHVLKYGEAVEQDPARWIAAPGSVPSLVGPRA